MIVSMKIFSLLYLTTLPTLVSSAGHNLRHDPALLSVEDERAQIFHRELAGCTEGSGIQTHQAVNQLSFDTASGRSDYEVVQSCPTGEIVVKHRCYKGGPDPEDMEFMPAKTGYLLRDRTDGYKEVEGVSCWFFGPNNGLFGTTDVKLFAKVWCVDPDTYFTNNNYDLHTSRDTSVRENVGLDDVVWNYDFSLTNRVFTKFKCACVDLNNNEWNEKYKVFSDEASGDGTMVRNGAPKVLDCGCKKTSNGGNGRVRIENDMEYVEEDDCSR